MEKIIKKILNRTFKTKKKKNIITICLRNIKYVQNYVVVQTKQNINLKKNIKIKVKFYIAFYRKIIIRHNPTLWIFKKKKTKCNLKKLKKKRLELKFLENISWSLLKKQNKQFM